MVDTDGNLPTQYFDFTNDNSGVDSYESPGLPDGNYPYSPSGTWPDAGDFVLSGGQVCIDATGAPVSCDDPGVVERFDHNLGADQAAYAIYSPEISDIAAWIGLGYDVLQLDIRMFDLNNGYEQIFLMRGKVGSPPPEVPEPATMILVGSGLLGFLGIGRKKGKRKI